MLTMYNRRTELVCLADVRIGDVLIDSTGREWFHVREIRPSGHTSRRLVLSGLAQSGLSYSHSAPKRSLVRRVVGK